ncbi:MAG TPA: type II toxin-antitoxin system VapB family antitoxin [Thermoanaerobaculia bacterium]|nr:type II toxin-antitoxin system VapB family antitoxin [Thermoanaerobaculia bacterium]
MKTTLELPDELFRRSKAMAAMRGESLKDLVREALQLYLERQSGDDPSTRGWRRVFGKAQREEVAPVDATVAEEFERIDPAEWR